jgi:hypothetical protein
MTKRMASQLLDGESTSGGFQNGSSPDLKLGGPFPSECARTHSINAPPSWPRYGRWMEAPADE